ncbi:MAG: hypothetical protein P9L94_11745 [Candidatus Hinthialibacter antarcticus]|nr:hypothetical protein [Candidatus Hinthialibacter antarcticus]
MNMKDAYIQKLEAQLNQWGAEIDKLKAKAENAQADAKIEYSFQIDELNSMKDAANDKLTELKNASDDAWEELKAGCEHAWATFSESVKTAVAKFQ